MVKSIETLKTFDINSIPDLDLVVLGALDLFSETELPELPLDKFKKPVVVGSVNAAFTSRIIFKEQSAYFADESSLSSVLVRATDADGMVIVSASGGKHAVEAAKEAKERNIPAILITNNLQPPAAEYINPERIFCFPKNREPYTYNTSTYLGFILSHTKEDPRNIKSHLEKVVAPKLLRDFSNYSSYVFIVPPQFSEMTAMVKTKFDELFGPYVQGRVFTSEEIKHAKTVATSGDELFISVGVQNEYYGLGKNRLSIPLLDDTLDATMIAVCYYIVGAIQKAHPPYFKNNIVSYCETASKIFGNTTNPIVE